MTEFKRATLARRTILAALGATLLLSATPVFAADPSGELVLLNWATGNEADMLHALEDGFVKAYPNVKWKEINLTTSGDQRGAIRAALQSGEKADLFINTWPAFRKELADAGLLKDLGPLWDSAKIGDSLSDSWKALGSTNGTLYGVTYTYGDRSAMFYKNSTMEKAGITTQPTTWDEFVANFKKLNAAGITPIAVGAKVWSHGEWFESMYEHLNGVKMAADLAAHKIPWTDPSVKNTLKKFAEMLNAGCCGTAQSMLAMDWNDAADSVWKTGDHGYQMIGMWNNDYAQSVHKLKEGTDYSIQQFPAMGAGHDNVSSVDSKEFSEFTDATNKDAADAFLVWLTTADAANIIASHGLASPSNKVDTSLYGPVMKKAAQAVAASDVQFVLGDLLPGDLVDEFRVQLQKFIQDPSDANIDAVTAAIEAKAKTFDSMTEVALSSRGSDGKTSQVQGGERKLTPLRRWIADAPAAYLLLLPVLVLFAFAVVYPLIQTVILSFWDIKGLGKPKFYGLGNFVTLAQDANFRQAVMTTLLWTISTTVISVGAGWAIALLCSLAPKQTLIPRVMIFAAFGVSEAVTGYVWLQVYRGNATGLINAILNGIGLGGFAHPWLGDLQTAIWCAIIAYSWAQTGLPLLVIYAATQAVSRNVIEAAYVDGASAMAIMRYIIAPLSMPGVRVAIFINLLGSLRAFDTIYVLTGGGPVRSTETIGYFMFRESFTQFKLGYGAAATLVLLAAVLLVSIPAIIQRTKVTT